MCGLVGLTEIGKTCRVNNLISAKKNRPYAVSDDTKRRTVFRFERYGLVAIVIISTAAAAVVVEAGA